MSATMPSVIGRISSVGWTTAVPVLAGSLAVALATAGPAAAQTPQCASRDAIVERLSLQFGEEPIRIAVTSTGDLLEVLASPQGTWTIIITRAGGPTCLMSAGEGWRGAPSGDPEERSTSLVPGGSLTKGRHAF